MERVRELQKMLQKVEPPRRLMDGFRKWMKERMVQNPTQGTTGFGGERIDLK